MRPFFIACNWKMNPQSAQSATQLVRGVVRQANRALGEVVLFPPTVFLKAVIHEAGVKVKCGAQDVSAYQHGAYTGQISANMLKHLGAAYVIVGHSERRLHEHETDLLVAQKVARAFEQKLIPLVCVGETNRVSSEQAWRAVKKQLDAVIPLFKKFSKNKYVLAYEPVWAIGGPVSRFASGSSTRMFEDLTNKKDLANHYGVVDPKRAAEMIARIKLYFRAQIGRVPVVLYGGSVNGKSVRDLLHYDHLIDGFLIGSASTQVQTIISLIKTIYGKRSRKKGAL